MTDNDNGSSIVVSNLTKSFAPIGSDKGITVLDKISFSVKKGERLAIMGRSGGGKSTLLGCLSGLEVPDAGTVLIEGHELAKMKPNELNAFRARSIGLVFQQFQLLEHFNALENVRLPLDLAPDAFGESRSARQLDAIAQSKLEQVGLGERLWHFPNQMSRGECQRVAIARVLVTGCQLIFADEPTGSLDVKTGQEVMDLLFGVVAETRATLVLVTHDPELAKRCDRVLQLKEGKLNGKHVDE